MKYILVVGDGMADMPIDALGGKTPLEFLAPENMAQVGGGALYRFRSCPEGLPPGSPSVVVFGGAFRHFQPMG